jgi:hypothetical protein
VTRRGVRVTAGFFDQLDAQLPAERPATGTPSRGDLLAIELPSIIHRFADAFGELPEVVERVSSARVLLAPGLSVHAFAIYGPLAHDGAIDLVGPAIDLHGPSH